jgi:hypothetical protein
VSTAKVRVVANGFCLVVGRPLASARPCADSWLPSCESFRTSPRPPIAPQTPPPLSKHGALAEAVLQHQIFSLKSSSDAQTTSCLAQQTGRERW